MKDFVLLIPYYNNREGLLASVNSIHYPDDKYEILVIDDGSKNELNVRDIEKMKPGAGIKVIQLPKNQGIAKALNAGLKELHNRNDYKYIARLDCGDTCHPDRFIEQVKFMDEHPEIALVGSWCRFIDKTSGKSYMYKTKLEHNHIVKEMHFKCSFIHPTVMFRKEILDTIGYYPENYPHAEDYAYFWSMLKQFKGVILPEAYVDIVMSAQTVSSINYREQVRSRIKIVKDFGTNPVAKYLGILLMYFRLIMPSNLISKTKYWFYK